jgi:hypothetical protein
VVGIVGVVVLVLVVGSVVVGSVVVTGGGVLPAQPSPLP